MPITPEVIQQLVAPAVLVPASGLLLLSSTARMNTVLARIRAFHRERLDVWATDAMPGSRDDRVRRLQLDGLEHQTRKLHSRARLLRITMLLLFASVACNLLAVIGLSLRLVTDQAGALNTAAVVIFLVGVALMLAAMGTSFVEVGRILETVTYEHQRVDRLCASDRDDTPAPRRHPDPHEPQGTQL